MSTTLERRRSPLDQIRTVLASEIGIAEDDLPISNIQKAARQEVEKTWVEKMMTLAGKQAVMQDFGYGRKDLRCVKKCWLFEDGALEPKLELRYFAKKNGQTYKVEVSK